MALDILAEKIAPEFEGEYRASLQKIQELYDNPDVLAAISGRMPNAGKPYNEEKYKKNIDDALVLFEHTWVGAAGGSEK